MGLNLDLCEAIGVPATDRCPRCGAEGPTGYDDYDIECGEPNCGPGLWVLDRYCHECEHEWTLRVRVMVVEAASDG